MKREVIVGALMACGVLSSVPASAQADPPKTVQKDIKITANVPHVVDFRIVKGQTGADDDHIPLYVDAGGKILRRDVNVTVHSNHHTDGVNVKLIEVPLLAHQDEKANQAPIPLTVKLDQKSLDNGGQSLTRSDLTNGETSKPLTLSIEPATSTDAPPVAGYYEGTVKVLVSPAT